MQEGNSLVPYDPKALGAACHLCPLNKQTPVGPSPPERGKPRFIIIGESPGRLEVLKGLPFIGPSGALLNRVLKEAGLKREEAHVTNALCCRPEDDRPETKLAALSCCAPRLANELKDLPRRLPVLPLGQPAARQLLGVSGIFKARGFVWEAGEIYEVTDEKIAASEKALEKMVANAKKEKKEELRATKILKKRRALLLLKAQQTFKGFRAVPTLHPAFILRGADGWYPVLINDVKRFRRLLELGKRLPLEDMCEYDVASTPVEVRRLVGALGEIHPGQNDISCDIETTGKDPTQTELKCLGFSDGEKTVVVYPWKESLVVSLRGALRDRVLVFHNGPQFDHIVMRRKKVW